MEITMVGLDHTGVAVAEREQFALTTARQTALLRAVTARDDVLGAVALSTCNRTELWAHTRPGASPPLAACLCEAAGVDPAQWEPRLHCRRGPEAAQYLFALACGLHSRVFGEDQILTQVREALDRARAAFCTDPMLEVLFRTAVTAAKEVKSGLQTSLANAGAVGCAVARLRAEGFPLRGSRCLVIGNGRMGKLAAQLLREAGAEVTVTVRQYRSGVVEIPAGCARIDYGSRMTVLPDCDLVLSATASPNVTVKYEELCNAGWRPGLLLIDLAVPRDIDPRAGTLPGVRLWDIDSFHMPESPEQAAARARAEQVLAVRLREFENWAQGRDLVGRVEAEAARFGDAAAARMPGGTPDAVRRQTADAAARQLRRFLFRLRDTGGADLLRACLTAAEQGEPPDGGEKGA